MLYLSFQEERSSMHFKSSRIILTLATIVGITVTVHGTEPSQTTEVSPGVHLLEAEDFAEFGDWRVDTQFTHKMGSAYLICPGADKPTQHPAKTTVVLPKSGVWQVWARTKDWLPEFSPGKFTLEVNGQRGALLGAAKRGWGWEKVGAFELQAGSVELTLRDLSGAYARCDAILFTQDSTYKPVDRRELVPSDVADGGEYDVVIVGAGPGGMGAALGAARNGARVALVFDRPIPGGNASEECGIGFDGASLGHKNARESGVVEEIRLLKASGKTTYTKAFLKMAAQSPNLRLFKDERVLKVEKNGVQISAVLSRNTRTGKWTRWNGKIFVDSTGDGWIGFFAGARTFYGREAGSEYGEEWIAPKVADKLTMSGTLSTGLSRPTGQVQPYETPVWARVLPKNFDRKIPGVGRPWWLEAPGRLDDVEDPETARDHLIRICFAYWGYVRNEWPERAKHGVEKRAFMPPSIFNGRREGMRIVGDYVLTANDCKAGRVFPDAVSYGGWSLDTHDPLGMDNPHGDGWWHPHMGVPIYTVPFRSLYSADVPNLLMGSRCESMTHIALGSMRVQGTQMAAGQAVGTAAALCISHNVLPRELGQTRIQELQQTLLKGDHYIPGLVNADPLDLARTATVTATSGDTAAYVIDGIARPVDGCLHGWVSDPECDLPQAITLMFPKAMTAHEIRLVFDSDLTPMRAAPPSETARQGLQGRRLRQWSLEAARLRNGECAAPPRPHLRERPLLVPPRNRHPDLGRSLRPHLRNPRVLSLSGRRRRRGGHSRPRRSCGGSAGRSRPPARRTCRART